MKKLIAIFLIGLVACKKPATTPVAPPPTILSVPDKTVSITCQTGCNGTLKVDWNYDWFNSSITVDSVYNYMSTVIFTNVTQGDSIELYWSSSICSSCGNCPSQISITVNGIVKQSWSNDNGLNNRYIQL